MLNINVDDGTTFVPKQHFTALEISRLKFKRLKNCQFVLNFWPCLRHNVVANCVLLMKFLWFGFESWIYGAAKYCPCTKAVRSSSLLFDKALAGHWPWLQWVLVCCLSSFYSISLVYTFDIRTACTVAVCFACVVNHCLHEMQYVLATVPLMLPWLSIGTTFTPKALTL